MRSSILFSRVGRWFAICPLLALISFVVPAAGRILRVPEDYGRIFEAINSSVVDDTVLVGHGFYSEQLRFPLHRLNVMGQFALSGDSLDLDSTIIDGEFMAEQDTATLVLFPRGMDRGSILAGFTLQRAYGILDSSVGLRYCGVLCADSCDPIVKHNRITDNRTFGSPVGSVINSGGELSDNEIFDNLFGQSCFRINANVYAETPFLVRGNLFGANPRVNTVDFPGLVVNSGARASIEQNRFVGLRGSGDVAIRHDGYNAVIRGNVFEDIVAEGFACRIVLVNHTNATIEDNVFRNIVSGSRAMITILVTDVFFEFSIVGNIFESVTTTGSDGMFSVACINLQGGHGLISNNIFRDTQGYRGGAINVAHVGLSEGSGVEIEYNLFEACSSSAVHDWEAIVTHYGGSPIIAHHNIFSRNHPKVVDMDELVPESLTDFRHNYWGHPSGPYHPVLNPDGLGDTVGDSVLFEPWLTDSLIDDADDPPAWIPTKTELISYPNPFNATARLLLSVDRPGSYSIRLYSLTGQLVRELWRGGVVISREINVDARDLASGVYFAAADELETGYRAAMVKMVLVR